MKIKTFIYIAFVAIMAASCGSNLKDKAKETLQQVMEQKENGEEPSQKEYADALSILNENLAAQTKIADDATKAVTDGDNEKAQELLNQLRSDDNQTQNEQLLGVLKSADLDDANKAALEEYEKSAQALSDKIVEITTSMLDLD